MPSHALTDRPSTDPLFLYRFRDSIYSTDLLTTAIVHLDLFTRLDRKPQSLKTLCQELGIHDRPADVMMSLMKSMGLIEERDELFHLTELAGEHLVVGSPWFIGPYYGGMKDRPVALDFLKVLRTGKPSNWASLRNEKAWAQAMEQEEFARSFTAAMDSRGVYLGQALAQKVDLRERTHLLDVAGGSGIYACCLAAANPELKATVLEKPPVDQIAARCIADRGYSSRVTVSVGDMFNDAWPTHADVHLISNVLHDWDAEPVQDLLRRSFESLQPGGVLLIHDMHLNVDKTGPLPVAQYSALLMNITEGKCYSIGELESMLTGIGFSNVRYLETAADRSVLVVDRPGG